MAVSRSKTWIGGEVLTASDLNAEFNNILDNSEDLGWPATKAKDLDGKQLILDSDSDSSLTADTDDRLDLKLAGVDLFRWDGTVSTPVNGLDFVASAAGSDVAIKAAGADTDVSIDIVPKAAGVTRVTSTETNAAAGPVLDLYRNSSSPADADVLGQFQFNGEDDQGAKITYGAIEATIIDATNGSNESDGGLTFRARVNDTLTDIFHIAAGIYAEGNSDPGAGKIDMDGFLVSGTELVAPSQGEAEAGTATTVRTFTAERVKQAIEALQTTSDEGTWTPTLTFDTAGDQSIAYTSQDGDYERIGKIMVATFQIVTSTFTHTTASGNLRISGLPATSANNGNNSGAAVRWGGITKANYTSVTARLQPNTSILDFSINASAQAPDIVDAADVPTAGTVVLVGTIVYLTG